MIMAIISLAFYLSTNNFYFDNCVLHIKFASPGGPVLFQTAYKQLFQPAESRKKNLKNLFGKNKSLYI